MATSKYGVGKYGFRLYSAIPFVDYAGLGPMSVLVASSLTAKFAMAAVAAVNITSTSCVITGVRGFYSSGAVSIVAAAELWEANTKNFSASASVDVVSVGNLSYAVPFTAFGDVSVLVNGNPYLGDFWNNEPSTKDTWTQHASGVSPWNTVTGSGSWSYVNNG